MLYFSYVTAISYSFSNDPQAITQKAKSKLIVRSHELHCIYVDNLCVKQVSIVFLGSSH